MGAAERVVLTGLITACTGLLTACRTTQPQTAPLLTVPVSTVQSATLENNLALSAEFEPFQEVDVMGKVAGYVRNINVDIGSHVKEGQVLAVLEVPEIAADLAKASAGVSAAKAGVISAQAAVERASAAANIAHLSYTRINDVAQKEKGLVPRQDIDAAQARDMEATAQLAGARSALQAAQESTKAADSEYQRAQAMMGYATIRAPFSGVVTKRYANTGSMIQAGISSQTQAMPVVRLAENSLLRLTLPVPVTDVDQVKDGEFVDVKLADSPRTLKGKIARFADSVQMATRTMDTQVDVPNPDGSLVPGMYAVVRLHLADRPHVLSVPVDAVDGLGTSVEQAYVVRNGQIHLVEVTTGLQTPTRLEVISGLQVGDQVIVGRHAGLFEGQKVQAQQATYETTSGSQS